jgi:hypothetical protein
MLRRLQTSRLCFVIFYSCQGVTAFAVDGEGYDEMQRILVAVVL